MMPKTIRVRFADWLMKIAYRLDPMRPKVVTDDLEGHTISLNGMKLARITPGTARRPITHSEIADIRQRPKTG